MRATVLPITTSIAALLWTSQALLAQSGSASPASARAGSVPLARQGVDADDGVSMLAAHEAYLKASNTMAGDQFGLAVAVSGDTIVVGAPFEDSSATGVDGDQGDEGAAWSGAAYVFVSSGASWVQQAYLKASNTGSLDEFGTSVAISGDTIVVGAYAERSAATGVDGDETDNSLTLAGAAYVFVRNGTSWSQQAYLKASNTGFGDQFGLSVSVSGETIVVGAYSEDSDANGVGGNQLDNSAPQAGAAYVFVRNGTTWSQQAYLKASNSGMSDQFGNAVAVSGDIIVVGAFAEDSAATGVNGDEASNGATQSGAAYVFVRSGTSWSQQAYLKASNTDGVDLFGWAVAASGDTVVVTANGEDSSSTGVNGNQLSEDAANSGAAYVYSRSGTTWSQQAYLKASNAELGDAFGHRVALSGDRLVVGALEEDSAANGVGGDQGHDDAVDSGAAYLFARKGTSWLQQAYLKGTNSEKEDFFGYVGLSGNRVVIGANGEDSAATGVDGDQDDDSASGAGAVYVFDLPPWIDLGYGLAGIAGVPSLAGSGPLEPGSAGALELSQSAPGAPAVLFVSLLDGLGTPFKCGTLVPVPVAFQIALATSVTGEVALGWSSWPAGLSGLDLFFQYAIQDGAAGCGVALSNALWAEIP